MVSQSSHLFCAVGLEMDSCCREWPTTAGRWSGGFVAPRPPLRTLGFPLSQCSHPGSKGSGASRERALPLRQGASLPDGSHEVRGGEVWRLGPWGLGWTGGQGWGALSPVLTPRTDSLDRAPPPRSTSHVPALSIVPFLPGRSPLSADRKHGRSPGMFSGPRAVGAGEAPTPSAGGGVTCRPL